MKRDGRGKGARPVVLTIDGGVGSTHETERTMPYDPDRHHRRSIRLRGYDYALPGAYFVTIVTQGRECLFGNVVNGEMRLNDAGRMVERWWLELARKFPTVALDAFVVMPNHIHGIIAIVGADLRVRPADLRVRPDAEGTQDHRGTHAGVPLPKIIQWFKTMITNEYIRHVKNHAWTRFRGRLWQRNYHEHIIRTDRLWDKIRRYILENPARWQEDTENPFCHRGNP